MFSIIARDDRAAEKDASVCVAALKACLSQLLLKDMVTMRNQVSSCLLWCKMCYAMVQDVFTIQHEIERWCVMVHSQGH